MFLVSITSFFIILQYTSGIDLKLYTDCGSLSTIVDVANINCYQEPCDVTRGYNYTGYTAFTPRVNHAVANLHLEAILQGVPITLEDGVNQCGQGLRCPIHAGETTSWMMAYPMPLLLPKLDNIAVKYQLKDQSDNVILCIVVPVSIV